MCLLNKGTFNQILDQSGSQHTLVKQYTTPLYQRPNGYYAYLCFQFPSRTYLKPLLELSPMKRPHLFRLRWQGCAMQGLKLGISQTVILSHQNNDNRAKLVNTDYTQKKYNGILAYKGKSFFKSSSTPNKFMHNLGSFYIYPYRFVYNSQIKILKYILNNLQLMPWTVIFNLFRASQQS